MGRRGVGGRAVAGEASQSFPLRTADSGLLLPTLPLVNTGHPFWARVRAQAHTHRPARASSKHTTGHPGLRLPFLLPGRAAVGELGWRGRAALFPSDSAHAAPLGPAARPVDLLPTHPLPASGGGWRGPVHCVS